MRRSHLTSVDDPAFSPASRMSRPTLQERLHDAGWLALVVLALAPLVVTAQVQLTYVAVPAIVAVASRWMGQLARWSAIMGAGLLAGVGAAGMPPSTMLFCTFALLALLAALSDGPRATRAAVVVTMSVAVLLVQRVLMRAGWSDEEQAIIQLATGCGACAVAAFAAISLTRSTFAVPPALALAVGVCAAFAAGRIVVQKHAIVFPRSVTRARDLTLAPPNPSAPELMQLQRLQNAGFRDAGLARAGVLVGRDADPATLRDVCFLGYRSGVLAASWAGQIALGDLVCRAVSVWPETGAAMLARALDNRGEDAALVAHLRGDILMDAGLVAPAITAYEAARAGGDSLATSDAVRGLLDRGRLDEAQALVKHAPATDKARARLALWTGAPDASGDLVSAWNELLDFTTLTPLSRRGVTVIGTSVARALGTYSAATPLVGRVGSGGSGAKGRALAMIDPDVGRGALDVVTEDVTAYGIRLPLPPRRRVPASMTLDLTTRLSFRFDIYTDSDVVSFTCGLGPADPEQRHVAMPDNCGTTTPVHLAPAEVIQGEVTRMELIGMFAAYRISIDEATP